MKKTSLTDKSFIQLFILCSFVYPYRFKQNHTIMNVHTYQKNLEQLLLTGERESKGKTKSLRPTYYSGVYILSRSLENQNFKLGMSWGTGGIYKRIISQYKICFAGKDEFFIRYLVICPKQKAGKKHFAYLMEQEMLKSIKTAVPIEEDVRKYEAYSNEYIFVPEITTLEKTMGQVLNNEKYKPYYTHAIKFVEDGFHKYDTVRGFHTELQDFSKLVNLNPTVHSMLALTNKNLKLDEKVSDMRDIEHTAKILEMMKADAKHHKEPKVVKASVVEPKKAKPKAKPKAKTMKEKVKEKEPATTGRTKKMPSKFKDYVL